MKIWRMTEVTAGTVKKELSKGPIIANCGSRGDHAARSPTRYRGHAVVEIAARRDRHPVSLEHRGYPGHDNVHDEDGDGEYSAFVDLANMADRHYEYDSRMCESDHSHDG